MDDGRLTRNEWKRRDDELQRVAYERDDGICQVIDCFVDGVVHHGIPKRLGGTRILCPLDKRVTICHTHHTAIHDRGLTIRLRDGRQIGPRGILDTT